MRVAGVLALSPGFYRRDRSRISRTELSSHRLFMSAPARTGLDCNARANCTGGHGASLERGVSFAPSILELYRRVFSRALIARRNLYARAPRATSLASAPVCQCPRELCARFAHNSLTWGRTTFQAFLRVPRGMPTQDRPRPRSLVSRALLDAGARSRTHARPRGSPA